MVSFNKAQTGSRVYRGVGTSPNMGQVSSRGAQGYIKRELRNKVQRPVGRDGQSDRRSGVAGRALKQMNSGGPKGFGGGKIKGVKPRDKQFGMPGKGKGRATGPSGIQAAPPPPPQIVVNDKGILELPYNQNFAAEQYQAVGEANDELLSLQQEEQQLALEIMQQRREADLSYGTLKKQTLSSNAGGGTAYSSKYGSEVGENATAYANTLSDLSNQESSTKADIAARRAAIQSALSQQLAAGVQGYGDELGEDAGTLGYGRDRTSVKNRGKKKPKPKPRGAKGGPAKLPPRKRKK